MRQFLYLAKMSDKLPTFDVSVYWKAGREKSLSIINNNHFIHHQLLFYSGALSADATLPETADEEGTFPSSPVAGMVTVVVVVVVVLLVVDFAV